jgi:hypothetical protein
VDAIKLSAINCVSIDRYQMQQQQQQQQQQPQQRQELAS